MKKMIGILLHSAPGDLPPPGFLLLILYVIAAGGMIVVCIYIGKLFFERIRPQKTANEILQCFHLLSYEVLYIS